MHKTSHLTVAALALLASVSLAAGAGSEMSKNAMAKDSLMLSSTQQKTAWNDLSAQATKQKTRSSFVARVGEALPAHITTHSVPAAVTKQIPELKSYQYALLNNNRLLIVNPSDKKIAEVITQ